MLERYRRMKVIVPHLGGMLPYMTGRIQGGYLGRPERRTIPKPPLDYMQELYYDTVSFHPPSLGFWLGIGSHSGQQWLGLALLAAFAAAAYFLSRRPERRDLFLLALAGTAVLAFIGCLVGRGLFSAMDDVGAILVMALVVLGEAGALVAWLRKMGSAEVDEA